MSGGSRVMDWRWRQKTMTGLRLRVLYIFSHSALIYSMQQFLVFPCII